MSFNRDELVRFLTELDQELSRHTDLVIIGGASLTLAYNFLNTTIDMDLLNKITADLFEAIEKAKSKTHLDVRVSTVGVYAQILNMEQRLVSPPDMLFKNINLYVPEKHDLALLKAARLEPRDMEDIRGLHNADSLNPETLFQRFKAEVLPLNSGDDNLLKGKFLEMIEMLFGEDMADAMESKI